jgi:hypothetical protein
VGENSSLDVPCSLYVNENGFIKLKTPGIVSIVQEENVDIDRIRVCPICDLFYWARRIEALTCSKKRCSNYFHQKKLQIKILKSELIKEEKNLSKRLSYKISPNNSLIEEQNNRVRKLEQKIHIEEQKIRNSYVEKPVGLSIYAISLLKDDSLMNELIEALSVDTKRKVTKEDILASFGLTDKDRLALELDIFDELEDELEE